MDALNVLIDAAAASAAEAGAPRITELAAKLAELMAADADLTADAIEAAAIEAFDELRASGDLSADAVTRMAAIADVCDAARQVTAQADADRAAAQAAVDNLAARLATPDADADADADPDDGQGDADPDADADADTSPAAAGAAFGARPGPGPKPTPKGAPPSRVPMGALAKHKAPPRKRGYVMEAAADLHGISAGSRLPGLPDLARAAVTRLGALKSTGRTAEAGIASIRREPTAGPGQLVANRGGGEFAEIDIADLEALTNERQLPGGSLVAAGGWCAPSPVEYDLCDPADITGLVDVPMITSSRGGVRWPASPDFATIYSSADARFCYTEAEIISGVTKPCYEVPCTTFNEARMDACGFCVKTPTLTERAYPELVANTIAQITAAHAHAMNARKIAKMIALSTANVVTTTPHGPGATATALSLLEMQGEYLRYRNRWDERTTIEMVAPLFLRPILRADLSKRNGVDLLSVTDETLDAYLRLRRIRPQWVYDMGDAFATGTPTDFGGTTAPKVWPLNVSVLLYRAGTFFGLQSDIIRINGLYDSALLAANMHLALFFEEGMNIGKRCWQSIYLTMPLCPDGATGAQVTVDCSTTGAA